MAAAVAVVAWITMSPARDAKLSQAPQMAAVREDVDSNGRVNILDAFALAREIERRGSDSESGGGREGDGARRFDLNNDGAVDRKDVDAVALAAVRLDREGAVQ